MSISPSQFARFTNLLSADMATQTIDQTRQQILVAQNQISTGLRITQPSDDPGNSAIVLQLQKTLDHQNQYLANVQKSQSQLSEVDSSLGSLTDLLTQAQTIASQNVGTNATAAQRAAAAAQVQTLYQQAISIGNTQFEGSYIYGGSRSNQQPFVSVNGGVQFVGSRTVLQNTASANTLLPFQVSSAKVFGASSGVNGSVDLTPSLTATTRISDLRGAGGNGVRPGTIQLGNGTVAASVDLSHADTIQDVVNSINAAAVGNITASISGNHLVLSTSGTDSITVSDVGGGNTAAALGIRQNIGAGAGTSVVGGSVQPNVTLLTPLSALRAGAGIDTTQGLTITTGQTTATVNLSSAATVQDLINAVASFGTSAQAQINSTGTGINIVNTVQGTQMTIAENGGTTAADLGVRTFSPSTSLSDLNGGQGVTTATPDPDFQVTRSDGTSFTVSLTGAKTIQDVIDDINTAAGGVGLTASFATTGNGIVLTDTAGGAGGPTVTALNSSSAAASLGLTTPAAGNVIQGSDVNPVESTGVFADLAQLQSALSKNDQAGITSAAEALDADRQRVITTRGQAGAQVQELQSLQTSLQTQNISTQALMSQIQDADLPSTITKFTTLQTALQASLQVAARGVSLTLMNFLT
jgi:flagellar hook-associated protein 2